MTTVSVALVVAVLTVFGLVLETTGQAPSNWCETPQVCWTRVAGEFNGQSKRFVNPSTGKFWHNDGWGDKRISVRYQPSDSFVTFDMSYQSDSSYKLWDYDGYVCDGFGTPTPSLHTKPNCSSEDHTHFYIYADSRTSTYLFKSKATNRFVRLDTNGFVTTLENRSDERALFQIAN